MKRTKGSARQDRRQRQRAEELDSPHRSLAEQSEAARQEQAAAVLGLPSYYGLPKPLALILRESPELTAEEAIERWRAKGAPTAKRCCAPCMDYRHSACECPRAGTAHAREKFCNCWCKYLCPPCIRGVSSGGSSADHRACSRGDCACSQCVADPVRRDDLRRARRARWAVEAKSGKERGGVVDGSPVGPVPPSPTLTLAPEEVAGTNEKQDGTTASLAAEETVSSRDEALERLRAIRRIFDPDDEEGVKRDS